MKRLTLLIAIFFILMFSAINVNAYAQGTEVNYAVSCEVLDCTQTYTVTVNDPDSITIIDDDPTSIQNGYLNFTLNSSQTSNNGDYQVFLEGNGVTPDYYYSTFTVTPNGEEPTEASAIFYIGLLALFVVFFGLLVYFGLNTDQIWVKAISIGFGYLFLIGISFIAWQMAADFITSSPFLIQFLRVAFLVLIIGFFPFLLALFAYGAYMAFTIKEITDMIDRGIPENEARERSGWKK